jgi:dihydropteroate synthase
MSNIKLVGILNITPDSFSDGGEYVTPAAALAQAEKLFTDGASLVDVGGESTNPRSTPITSDEEWQRIKDVLSVLLQKYPGKISVDSYHPETHLRLQEAGWGDFIINDVTGFNNPEMVKVAAQLGMSVIVSNLPAKFKVDIQAAHASTEPLETVEEVKQELLKRHAELVTAGIPTDKIILDPGIGFGKTMELNAKLVACAKNLPGKSVMVGYSRKRFLGENRMDLEPNIEAGRKAIAAGATYLRIHDVAEHASLLKSL